MTTKTNTDDVQFKVEPSTISDVTELSEEDRKNLKNVRMNNAFDSVVMEASSAVKNYAKHSKELQESIKLSTTRTKKSFYKKKLKKNNYLFAEAIEVLESAKLLQAELERKNQEALEKEISNNNVDLTNSTKLPEPS